MNYPPIEEQSICKSCGFCCDNTLFDRASIYEGEKVKGYFKSSLEVVDGSRYFKLSCVHFDQVCTIYDQDKPKVCSSFKCKLLHQFTEKEVEYDKAMNIIKNAKSLRTEILELFNKIEPKQSATFRDILAYIKKNETNKGVDFKLLEVKCNIFSVLLTRYFRSKKSFNEFLEIEPDDKV